MLACGWSIACKLRSALHELRIAGVAPGNTLMFHVHVWQNEPCMVRVEGGADNSIEADVTFVDENVHARAAE